MFPPFPPSGQDRCTIVSITPVSDEQVFKVRDLPPVWAREHPRKYGNSHQPLSPAAIGLWMVVEVQDGRPLAYLQGSGILGHAEGYPFDLIPHDLLGDANALLGSEQFFKPAFFLRCEDALFEALHLNRLDDVEREACGLSPRAKTGDVQVAFFCYIPEPGDRPELVGAGEAAHD